MAPQLGYYLFLFTDIDCPNMRRCHDGVCYEKNLFCSQFSHLEFEAQNKKVVGNGAHVFHVCCMLCSIWVFSLGFRFTSKTGRSFTRIVSPLTLLASLKTLRAGF